MARGTPPKVINLYEIECGIFMWNMLARNYNSSHPPITRDFISVIRETFGGCVTTEDLDLLLDEVI